MKNTVETIIWPAKAKVFTVWLFTEKGSQILTRVVSNTGICPAILLRDQNEVL